LSDNLIRNKCHSLLDVDVLLGQGGKPGDKTVLMTVAIYHLSIQISLDQVALVGQQDHWQRQAVWKANFLFREVWSVMKSKAEGRVWYLHQRCPSFST